MFAHLYLYQQLPEEFAGTDLVVEGVVRGIVDKADRSMRFNFEITRYLLNVNGHKKRDKAELSAKNNLKTSYIRVSWYYYTQSLHSGERWRLHLRLKPPHGMQNPGGFDYEKWLYQKGLHATGYVRKSEDNQLLDAYTAGVRAATDQLREKLLELISEIPDKRYQGLLQALTVGHKSLISPDQWQVLRNTGTSHLMAISGLHIGLVAGLIFFLLRRLIPARLSRLYSAPQIAAVVSLFGGLFYALLAGFTVPTQRAFVMLLVVMLAIMFKRPAFSLNNLALALIAVILINPVSVLSAGFWLSFLAVIIIALVSSSRLAYAPPSVSATEYSPMRSRLDRWLSGVRVQWLIALGMLPLSVLLFHQGSLISPLANMLVIPLVGFLVVPMALLASLLSMVSTDMAIGLFTQASNLLAFTWHILQWLEQGSVVSWKSHSVPLLYSIFSLLGITLILMPKGFPLRYAGLFLLLPMLFYKPERPLSGDLWVSVLDVGQGLSVLLQTHQKSLLYDTGARFNTHFDMGEKNVLPYLQTTGIQQLDTLVISHADNDHAGGAGAILSGIKVKRLIAAHDVIRVLNNATAEEVTDCRAGESWDWDGVSFEILHPGRHYTRSNNRSCVLRVSGQHFSLLLPGDIESKVESALLKRYSGALSSGKLQSDVIIVPHHGSNTSSTRAFIKALKPQLAIVSAGYKNRFGHPTTKIMNRYRKMGSQLLNTADQGAIQVKFSNSPGDIQGIKPFKVIRQRKLEKHYWNHRAR